MVFAWLFIFVFIIGAFLHALLRKWRVAVGLPVGFFLVFVIFLGNADGSQVFAIGFGVIIVFFASLLGSYVVQISCFESPSKEDEQE